MTPKSKLVVVTPHYPKPDSLYGDVFVHSRLKKYLDHFEIHVVGYNRAIKEKSNCYTYQGISVYETGDRILFEERIQQVDPQLIVIHFINEIIIDVVSKLSLPTIVFFHGFDVTTWRRRLMNYDSIGSIRYLIPYAYENIKRRKAIKHYFENSKLGDKVKPVFVSQWLKTAAEEDLGMEIANGVVIHNGIDTDLFVYKNKDSELRKQILIIRPFSAINYANDISVETILLLSKESFFNDLHFSIYGEGYLFKKLTDQIRHFPNVTLHNYFIENTSIPSVHEKHGIFLCPSRLDSQGVSLDEAMSSGLVPITSPIGGIPEFVEHEVSGFMENNAEKMAERIKQLYFNPDQFLRMSVAASKQILSKCALKNTVQQEINLIQSMLTSKAYMYKQCTNCILDSNDDPFITFNEQGMCNHCQRYKEEESKISHDPTALQKQLHVHLDKIKSAGVGKPYDCILGISGGVDSTYLALKAKEFGLRPLLVHFDNGWNSELAIKNIENVVTKLGFDLHTIVIDWEEFRDLQLAFLRASVVDIELLTDHAIVASLYRLALQHKIKYILSGVNFVTESILPSSWIHDKRDYIHIRAINKLFGTREIKKYPILNSWLIFRAQWLGVKSVTLLDYMPYIKEEVRKAITTELQWRDYGGKHYESIFTRFYQGYILSRKFGIDKRKAHYSNLICSGQISREAALEQIQQVAYNPQLFATDYEYVLKKFKVTKEEFEEIMNRPPKKHSDYPVSTSIFQRFTILKLVRPLWRMIKKSRV